MAESDRNEPINEQVVANMYTAMRSELNQIYSKITELEMDVSEHSLVINAIQPLDPSRRCYRMIGGVLVERTIKEVLPAVQRNKEGIEEVIARLNEAPTFSLVKTHFFSLSPTHEALHFPPSNQGHEVNARQSCLCNK